MPDGWHENPKPFHHRGKAFCIRLPLGTLEPGLCEPLSLQPPQPTRKWTVSPREPQVADNPSGGRMDEKTDNQPTEVDARTNRWGWTLRTLVWGGQAAERGTGTEVD